MAESCTGGLVSSLLTDLAGSSAWYAGGVVVYSNEAKRNILGVPQAVLDIKGAVSRETVLAMNGPADFMETPVSPITGTKFDAAAGTKMLHITEFTADLIKNGKLKLDPSRNDNFVTTYHDSCNTARGMGSSQPYRTRFP